ncbi:hypothetical protein, partial [Novosphingobium sp.]|uniref:hypothetical protein n=1 Tax=Novosphingobium sp. TaxID=1874826 RepID=UPI002B480F32
CGKKHDPHGLSPRFPASPATQLIEIPRKRTISAWEVCQMDKQQNIEARPGDAERPQESCVDGPFGSRAEAKF